MSYTFLTFCTLHFSWFWTLVLDSAHSEHGSVFPRRLLFEALTYCHTFKESHSHYEGQLLPQTENMLSHVSSARWMGAPAAKQKPGPSSVCKAVVGAATLSDMLMGFWRHLAHLHTQSQVSLWDLTTPFTNLVWQNILWHVLAYRSFLFSCSLW